MTHPPAKLWLQWHGDGDPDDPSPVHEELVTWAKEKVFDSDVCYVRVDVAAGMSRDLSFMPEEWRPMSSAPKDRPILVVWGIIDSSMIMYDIVRHHPTIPEYVREWESEISGQLLPFPGHVMIAWRPLLNPPSSQTLAVSVERDLVAKGHGAINQGKAMNDIIETGSKDAAEVTRLRALLNESLEVADECLALLEEVGHGAHTDNVTAARKVIEEAMKSANRNAP